MIIKSIKLIAIPVFMFLIYSCGNTLKMTESNQQTQTLNHRADTIPFRLTAFNNIVFEVLLNQKDSLFLKFDSGATGLLLKHSAIKEKTTLLKDHQENESTKNYVKLNSKSVLQIGNLRWDSLDIYPVTRSGHGTDGRFGWDLFKDKFVELNYDKSLMIIHKSLPTIKGFTKAKLNIVKTIFCIDGAINLAGKTYKGPFLFDTGYQKSLLLDSIIMQEQDFPKDLEVLKINKLTNGAGKVFITKVVEIPELSIGGQTRKNIPTQLLNTQNPAGFKTHILGNELLKRFNTIFDFKSMTIYMKENSLVDELYSDAKK